MIAKKTDRLCPHLHRLTSRLQHLCPSGGSLLPQHRLLVTHAHAHEVKLGREPHRKNVVRDRRNVVASIGLAEDEQLVARKLRVELGEEMRRTLQSSIAAQADEVQRDKEELRRLRLDDLGESRRVGGSAAAAGRLSSRRSAAARGQDF